MNRIRELREAGGLKQAELAKMMHCSIRTISRYELEQHEIDSVTICRLCDIFGCTADYLLCRNNAQRAALSQEDAAILAAFHDAPVHVQDGIRALLNISAPEIKEKLHAS